MKTGKIQLTDNNKIKKILDSNNYLLVIVSIMFLIVSYDLFNPEPIYLKTDGFFWKGLAILVQLSFIISIIQWELKKKRIINILTNGICVKGSLLMSEKIKPNQTSSFYIHLFEYNVENNKYEVTMKNKNHTVKSDFIIYQSNDPKNSVIYEDLKNDLKKMVQKEVETK